MNTVKGKLVSIYRSKRKEGMYLYVPKQEVTAAKGGLGRVPEALLKVFGPPEHSMTLLLNSERKLARAEAPDVLAALDKQGFYLQMPEADEDYMKPVIQAKELAQAMRRDLNERQDR